MYIKSILLLVAFGLAMVAGMRSTPYPMNQEENSDPTVPKKLNAVTQQPLPNQPATPVQKSSQETVPPQQDKKGTLGNSLQVQSGERLNSVHFGLSHKELQTMGTCSACHREVDEDTQKLSPYLHGFFSNRDSKSVHKVDVAFLGVNASDVPGALKSHLNLEKGQGAIVNRVVDESPAYHCGIEEHDVLISIDKQPILGEKNLLEQVRSRKPGTKIVVEFVRGGKTESCNLVLGKQKTAQILNSYRISGCKAQLTSATNCQSCHAIDPN